jgi:hypothetical protein
MTSIYGWIVAQGADNSTWGGGWRKGEKEARTDDRDNGDDKERHVDKAPETTGLRAQRMHAI